MNEERNCPRGTGCQCGPVCWRVLPCNWHKNSSGQDILWWKPHHANGYPLCPDRRWVNPWTRFNRWARGFIERAGTHNLSGERRTDDKMMGNKMSGGVS